MKMMETRRSRFKRMAVKRTNKVLEQLRILGNLSNRSHYDFTEVEVNKMFKAIEEQLRGIKSKFRSKRERFSL